MIVIYTRKTRKQIIYLFLRKARTNTDDINNVSLYNADICEVFSPQRLQVFPLSISLFLLLSEALMAKSKTGTSKSDDKNVEKRPTLG